MDREEVKKWKDSEICEFLARTLMQWKEDYCIEDFHFGRRSWIDKEGNFIGWCDEWNPCSDLEQAFQAQSKVENISLYLGFLYQTARGKFPYVMYYGSDDLKWLYASATARERAEAMVLTVTQKSEKP